MTRDRAAELIAILDKARGNHGRLPDGLLVQLAKHFGLHRKHVGDIGRRKYWQSIPRGDT